MSEVSIGLKSFLIEQSYAYEKDINMDSEIQKDFRIYGDEAVEFIIAFGKKFNVDVSHFMAADYFFPEGNNFLTSIFHNIIGKKKKEMKILTVGHLEKAIKVGRLDDEVVNSK